MTLSQGSQGYPFEIRKLPARKSNVKALNLLTSKRWLPASHFPVGRMELPYIDRDGKYTGESLYSCNFQPQSYMSIVFSTMFRRIRIRALRSNSIGEVNKRQNILLKCCAYYALSKNSYFYDRFLYLLRNLKENWKTIKAILHRYVTKLDAHKWFVYGHVCLQTQWLTSRALRPRDKSALQLKFRFMLPVSLQNCEPEALRRYEYEAIWSSFVGMVRM